MLGLIGGLITTAITFGVLIGVAAMFVTTLLGVVRGSEDRLARRTGNRVFMLGVTVAWGFLTVAIAWMVIDMAGHIFRA